MGDQMPRAGALSAELREQVESEARHLVQRMDVAYLGRVLLDRRVAEAVFDEMQFLAYLPAEQIDATRSYLLSREAELERVGAAVLAQEIVNAGADRTALLARVYPDLEKIISPWTFSPDLPVAAALHLSTRERQVLTLVVEGLSTHAISAKLGITSTTVKKHVMSARRKLEAENRTQVAALVLQPERP